MPISKPILNAAGSGEVNNYGNGSSAEIVVGGPESDNEYAVLRYHVKRGDEPPLHTHSLEDEMIFVQEGEITAIVGDDQIDVGPGAFAALPRGIPHTIKVKGDSVTVLLTVIPAGVERFFVPAVASDNDPTNFGLEIHLPPE